MDGHIFELSVPVTYATKGGENDEATFVTLVPPTYKQLEWVTPIKQAVTSAIAQLTKDQAEDAAEESGDDGEITSTMMLSLLYQWDGDMNKVFLYAQELFRKGGALLDGDVKMTEPLLHKLDLGDFEKMVGEYIARFLAPSLMAGE